MFSHTMDVYNGQFSYIANISRDVCRRMHTYGSFEIARTHITKPKDTNPSAPDNELQEHNETETKLEPIYPLLPPEEDSTYTLELRG
ncbi:hypothetical protein ALC60_09158 [Trachymyrmex zeteki]|uniref:Uncharacterized protein n=1 Tax=Mycetomoellerius zeteki TaxID=64791 RepID=A0A151WV52_9HYME|nr:hypothetical protein ALC60_09158 [Trachymyrmex zeteki]